MSAETQLIGNSLFLKFHVICPFTTFKSTKEKHVYNEFEKCAFQKKKSIFKDSFIYSRESAEGKGKERRRENLEETPH